MENAPLAVPERCPFCDHRMTDYSRSNCTSCNFPVFGTVQEQTLFRASNKKLKSLIDDTEAAFSSARFFMLWPPLLNIILWLILFRLSANRDAMFVNCGISLLVIAMFFVSQRRPLPVMMLYAALALSVGLLNEIFHVTRLQWFGVAMVMMSQLYGIWMILRMEKALKEKRIRENLPL